MAESVIANEQDFWEEHGQTFDEVLAEYNGGPDPNSRLMLDSLEPLAGKTVLDVACGSGVTTVWLAERGARAVGIDVTPKSVQTAQRLADHVGVEAQFQIADLNSRDSGLPVFDRIAGRYALHHLDIPVAVPLLAGRLAPGGKAAFIETVDSNRLLRLARTQLVHRLGLPSFSSTDEHPLTAEEMKIIERSFGELQIALAEMIVFRIFDRQVLRFRSSVGTQLCGLLDKMLYATGAYSLSYRQVLVATKLLR